MTYGGVGSEVEETADLTRLGRSGFLEKRGVTRGRKKNQYHTTSSEGAV